ncbi:MAG: MotA/TolQ/ExbB proton channel family protein [Thermodesulfobacteriota bacterium]|nr:MotA/TolQ/ExbB proton channel family protein [Thermodesulfobacteriota bacterium]
MEALSWIFKNFGFFFAAVFLLYIFLAIRNLVQLYDYLRHVDTVQRGSALGFLQPLFDRLRQARLSRSRSFESVIDAIWADFDSRISSCHTTLNGYVSTLVLIGFAGTICGSIGAFREMFKGLADGRAATEAFLASWNSGLSTALYTSLGSATVGAVIITLICSRWMQQRIKQMESHVALAIADILEEETHESPSA